MTATQKELPLYRIAPNDPNVDWLVGFLGEHGNWASADVICVAAGKQVTEYWRRWVRALADASHGRVMSAPGSPGYKLTCKCTPEEMKYAEALKSQSDKMRQRYIDIMAAWHKREVPS